MNVIGPALSKFFCYIRAEYLQASQFLNVLHALHKGWISSLPNGPEGSNWREVESFDQLRGGQRVVGVFFELDMLTKYRRVWRLVLQKPSC
jgi:hypothetical protein